MKFTRHNRMMKTTIAALIVTTFASACPRQAAAGDTEEIVAGIAVLAALGMAMQNQQQPCRNNYPQRPVQGYPERRPANRGTTIIETEEVEVTKTRNRRVIERPAYYQNYGYNY